MTPAPGAADIQAWLVAYVAKELASPPEAVDVAAPLTELGLSSRQVVILGGDLEDWLGREVPDTAIWDYPSIRALSAHLAGGAA